MTNEKERKEKEKDRESKRKTEADRQVQRDTKRQRGRIYVTKNTIIEFFFSKNKYCYTFITLPLMSDCRQKKLFYLLQ